MDISMPIMNGIEATRRILSHRPETRVIALTGADDLKTVQQMIAAGAVGYILKDAHPEEITGIIQSVHNGKSVFSTDAIKPLLDLTPPAADSPDDYGLTRREMQVLQAMGEGLNNGEVAEKLNITTPTVRFHITNIIEKLDAANRTEALIIAARRKLI
jgi:DNA-binding NarL/FixJ family response regulator